MSDLRAFIHFKACYLSFKAVSTSHNKSRNNFSLKSSPSQVSHSTCAYLYLQKCIMLKLLCCRPPSPDCKLLEVTDYVLFLLMSHHPADRVVQLKLSINTYWVKNTSNFSFLKHPDYCYKLSLNFEGEVPCLKVPFNNSNITWFFT